MNLNLTEPNSTVLDFPNPARSSLYSTLHFFSLDQSLITKFWFVRHANSLLYAAHTMDFH